MSRILGLHAWAAAAVFAFHGLAPGCNEPDFAPEGDGATLGEVVYQVIHDNLERADLCGAELAAAMEPDRDRFVTNFDHAISEDVVDSLPELLGGTLLPVVDSGALPAVTDALSEALALLIDDDIDPDRSALRSALQLAHARSPLDRQHGMALARALFADPNLTDRIHALAAIARERDGTGNVLGTVLNMVGRNLELETPSVCDDLLVDDLDDILLSSEPFVPDPAMGAPAWAVRADVHGNPQVTDRANRLPAPFVDADGDGAADVDDLGRPVDAQGEIIRRPAFGRPGESGYDAQGRAVTDDGELLYTYVDAKQTALSHLLQLLRAALEADAHRDLLAVVESALGDPQPCAGDGCFAYPADDHPIADLAFLLLELAKQPGSRALVETFAVLLEEEPALAEDVLVAVGNVIQAFEASTLSVTDRQLLQSVRGLLPLISDVFALPADGGQSTSRLLIDLIEDLGSAAVDFPAELKLTIDYHRLHKGDDCSADMPDLSRSAPVDLDLPRHYRAGGIDIDNRSALERVVELLDVADCGSVPFSGGRTVTYVVLDLLSNRSPATACNVIDGALGIIDVAPGAGDFLVSGALNLIGCNGDRVVADVRALDDLAKSGGLDFLLPIAKTFKEQGQLQLLIDIVRYLARDLRRDEDGDPGSASVVRQILSPVSAAIDAGVADALLRLVSVLSRAQTADGAPLADNLIDALAFVVDDSVEVRTRLGQPAPSYADAVLASLQTLANRLRVGRAEPAFHRLLAHLASHLTQTRVDSERELLTNRNLVPLLSLLTSTARRATRLRPAAWECALTETQSSIDELLLGRDFASAVRLMEIVDESEAGEQVQGWVQSLLTPGGSHEALGPLLQVSAGLLGTASTTPSGEDIDVQPLFTWLGRVAQQRSADGADLVGVVDRMLAADENGTLLAIGENLVSPGPLPSGEAPLETFIDMFDAVSNVSEPMMCAADPDHQLDVVDAERTLRGVVDFLGGDGGLSAIYGVVGVRRDRVHTSTP